MSEQSRTDGREVGVDVCLMIEGQEGVTWDQWLALAAAGERYGFQALFRSDHYLSFGRPHEAGALDAWSTLNALAARTERIHLGTLVSPVTFRHPALLAKSVATADHVSGGRVEVGIGAGWFEGEHRAYGFAFPPTNSRWEMYEEQVEIVHRLLDSREATVAFEGRHYRLEDCPALPKPVQQPHPPLLLGGGAGAKAAALAARWADEYNLVFADAETCRERGRALDAACEAIERDPSTLRHSLMTNVVLGDDEREFRARALAEMRRRGEDGDVEEFIEKQRAGRLWGTVEQALEQLGELADAGIERVMLQHLAHEDLDTVALIGERLIPQAAGLRG